MTENNAAQPGQDDIAARLRENADLDAAEDGNPAVIRLEREAADEIERLRALLSKLRAEGVQAGDERPSLRGAANLAFNALHECKPVKGAEKQYSDAIQALQSALHNIAYTVNRTATPQQFANHLQREARAALASAPASEDGLTAKQAWWAGYRAGKGLPPDTPRQDAVKVDISSARLVTHWPNGTPRDERDTASDPEGKLIHDPTEPLLAASAPVAGEADQPDIDTLRRIGAAHDARRSAPQASEAVRDAALEEAARVLVRMDATPRQIDALVRAIGLIRALKSQSDALSEPKCPRCALPLRQECNCDEGYAARVALSAQPGTQKGPTQPSKDGGAEHG